MSKYFILRFLITGIIIILISSAYGFDTPGSSDAIFGFAEYLENTGDYYRAITEYKRFIFLWPENELSNECRYRIGRSYLYGSDYENAISEFQNLYNLSSGNLPARKIQYAYSKSLFMASRYKQAAFVAKNNMPDLTISKRQAYDISWCYLKDKNIKSALQIYQELAETEKSDDRIFNIRDAIVHLESLPEKRPCIAGVMSAILPGSGQIYAGRWRDGLISFLINGLFISAIAGAIDKDHDETAAILGFLELGFYSANIYNSLNDAHKYNQSIWKNELLNLETQFGPPFSRPWHY